MIECSCFNTNACLFTTYAINNFVTYVTLDNPTNLATAGLTIQNDVAFKQITNVKHYVMYDEFSYVAVTLVVCGSEVLIAGIPITPHVV